jgi:hypothetical protein
MRYLVTGPLPVVIDGHAHAPGAHVETDSDVTFLVTIGALAPAAADEPMGGPEAPPLDEA